MLLAVLLGVVAVASAADTDNRTPFFQKLKAGLGVTFYTPAEMITIAKCYEPTFYKTPTDTDGLYAAGKKCVIDNSGSKAPQALSLYSNGNDCLNPEKVDDLPDKFSPPLKTITANLTNTVLNTLSDCKKNNKLAAAAKQESCMQQVYGLLRAGVTVSYVDTVCQKLVKKVVSKQEYNCGIKILPQVVNIALYKCSKMKL